MHRPVKCTRYGRNTGKKRSQSYLPDITQLRTNCQATLLSDLRTLPPDLPFRDRRTTNIMKPHHLAMIGLQIDYFGSGHLTKSILRVCEKCFDGSETEVA